MSYDLISTNRSSNPIDNINPWAHRKREYELHNTQRFNFKTWPMLLTLAHIYGWQPLGLLPGGNHSYYDLFPDLNPEYWEEDYCTNRGQVISTEDAAALANALESALNDIPDNDLEEDVDHESTEYEQESKIVRTNAFTTLLLAAALIETDLTINASTFRDILTQYFSGPEKQGIVDFISFCRKGAFYIW